MVVRKDCKNYGFEGKNKNLILRKAKSLLINIKSQQPLISNLYNSNEYSREPGR